MQSWGFRSHRKYFPFLALLHGTYVEVMLINVSHMKGGGADAEWSLPVRAAAV